MQADPMMAERISRDIRDGRRRLTFQGDDPQSNLMARAGAREAIRQLNGRLFLGDPARVILKRCNNGCCLQVTVFW